MLPRAVLFDFDGVLADTANVHIAAWQRTFRVMGWHESDETCAHAAEIDDRTFVAEVFARRKIEGGDVEGWARRKQALTVRLLSEGGRVVAGVADLVRTLRGQTRLAVVSTTWRANIVGVLDGAGLLDAFEFVIAKEDVQATKPDPEAYRLALRLLDLEADAVVAVEDSPSGLRAATDAGLRVIAIGPTGSDATEPRVDRNDTRALAAAIGLPD